MGTEGLANLFVAHRRKLEALARGIVGDRDEAADVVSDAFVAFLERGPRDPDEAGAWLYVVTRNKARNRVRDRARAARRPRPFAEPVFNTAPVDERIVTLLADAADTLPDRDARALEFRFRHGLEYSEIAAALGISVAATRVLVHRASRRLRGQTVGLLADHHGASVSCRSEMLREAVRGRVHSHEGCPSCAAVAEEVHALAARGVFALPVPIGDRLVDNPLNRWVATHWPGRSVSPSPRSAEAFAALMVSGALVVGGSGGSAQLPAASAPDPVIARVPSATSQLAIGEPEVGATGELRPIAGVVTHDVEAIVPGAPRNLRTFEDRAGDSESVAADVFELPRLLGVPLYAPDALNGDRRPSADVRSLQVGTMADGNGEATGLYFRIGLGAPPDGSGAFHIGFFVGESPCQWSIWMHPDMEYGDLPTSKEDDRFLGTFHTSFVESCSPNWADSESTAGDGGFTNGTVEFAPYAAEGAFEETEMTAGKMGYGYDDNEATLARISGRGVALEIPFDVLGARHRRHIDDAHQLRQLSAIAGVDLEEQDQLPDSGGLDYRIERRA